MTFSDKLIALRRKAGHCGRGLRRMCGCGKGVCEEKRIKKASPAGEAGREAD